MGAQAVRLSNVDIDNALKNRDFEVLFQPIFDLGNGALARMETFVRWRHPSLGALPPGAFISFFESQGRMSELTRYILAEALDNYLEWRGPSAPGFSINLALSDLTDDAFAAHFTKLLRDKNFPPDLVTLECPMPPVDMSIDAASQRFAALAETGARVAIEVRGRANDLLRNIDPFPFHEIKTGGSSILRFARTVRGPGMSAISDLLDIAGNANAAIIAVGVEDQASLSALRGLGFTAAQGNHLGAVGEIEDFMPSRVNEVRELLGLSPLSAEDLSALFRTEAPALKAAEGKDELEGGEESEEPVAKEFATKTDEAGAAKSTDKAEDGDDVVNRLNKRVASQADAEDAKEDAPDENQNTADDKVAEDQTIDTKKPKLSAAQIAQAKAKMREKAKTLALAKRAKLRKARKKAAIERAKSRTGGSTEPHAMQSRIEEEFAGRSDSVYEDQPTSVASKEITSEIIDVEPQPAAEDKSAAVAPPNDAEKLDQDTTVADDVAAKNIIEKTIAHEDEMESLGQQTMRLAVGASNAFFQPGVSVRPAEAPTGSLAPLPDDSNTFDQGLRSGTLFQDEPPLAEDFSTPAKKTPTPTSEFQSLENVLPTPTPVDDDGPEEIIAEPPDEEQSDAVVNTDPESVDAIVIDRPRRKKKNFLTRKYKVVPTHFWPKSWKRKYRAWKRANAEKQIENITVD
ncbi:MAG: EAL domain-containing protein [Marinicaulis sp.]|nr:EAL domain-containing protein [Marinicaulis sp.]